MVGPKGQKVSIYILYEGSQMAERLGNRAINMKVAGSTPGREK